MNACSRETTNQLEGAQARKELERGPSTEATGKFNSTKRSLVPHHVDHNGSDVHL